MTPLARTIGSAILLATVAPLGAQQAVSQTRDPSGAAAKPAVTGTGVIFGRVVIGDAPDRPARHATITVSGSGLSAARIAVTDAAGRYAVEGLATGHYSVVVTKPAYVRTLAGPKASGSTQPTVDVLDGQRVQTDVVLPRGAVITGRVLDSNGKPRASVQVRAVQLRTRNGQRVVSGSAGIPMSTDDEGVYRIYGLAADDYVLAASMVFATSQSPRVSEDQLQWARRVVTNSASAGPAGAMPAPPSPPRAAGDAAVYYPGSADIAAAGILTVTAGEERSGVDITLMSVPLARIEGTVTGPVDFSNLTSTQMSVVASTQRPGMLSPPIAPFVRPDRTGHFVVDNIAPGSYLVAIRTVPSAGRGNAATPPAPSLWASASVDVNGEDVTGITLELQRGLTFAGKLVVDGATPAFDFARVRVGLASTQTTMTLTPTSTTAASDGTFAVTDIVPGPFRCTVTGLPPEWSVKSIDVGGTDAADRGVEIAAGQNLSNVIVTLTDHAASLSGALLDRAGKGVPYTMLLFSTDRAYWSSTARRTRQTRATSDGAYSIKGIPAGEYYLVAIPDMSQIDLTDPTTFDELAASGYKLTLAEGEQKKQDMKISGGS